MLEDCINAALFGLSGFSETGAQQASAQRQRAMLDAAAAKELFAKNCFMVIDGECERVEIKSIGCGSGD